MKPTEDEMHKEIDKCGETPDFCPGMSYVEGVQATLEWVLGITDLPPMDDE